jgi:glycosyltransferase involved in cell wall biosynthesis
MNIAKETFSGRRNEPSRPRMGRARKLKVLIVDEEIPFPPNAGKRIRTWNLLRRLAEEHDLTLLCYGSPEEPGLQAIRAAGIRVDLVPTPSKKSSGWAFYLRLFLNLFSPYPYSVVKHFSSEFQAALDHLLTVETWDLLQCEWTPYMHFLRRKIACPVVVATHNVENQIWDRRARHGRNIPERLFFRLQAWKMKQFEKSALRRATAVTAVTWNDAEVMSNWGVADVTVVANGADIDFYDICHAQERECELLSVSSLDWYPNEDALEFFVREILPEIRKRRPDVKFSIVGRRPQQSLRQRLQNVPGVVFHGEVEDVRPFVSAASVVVVPLRIGGGSRLKILEALAGAKAVVSTSVGAEGLDVNGGEHLLIADDPTDFAQKVIELLESPERRHQLGQAGRQRIMECYGWENIAKRMEHVWNNICEHKRTTQN